jgi:hypothetical protein
MSNSINNLNIFTFIKDIYQSLKNIDKYFNDFNTNVNSRLTKLEDNQVIILDKLSSIETFLSKLNETNTTNILLNKNIENELLEKMKIMNNNTLINNKVELKPDELTFANILENDYTLSDINKSLLYSSVNVNANANTNADNINLTNNFKSSSSGSNYYSNSNSNNNYDTNTNTNNNINNNINNIINDDISDNLNNLNNLLF